MFRPPSSIGFSRCSRVILWAVSLSHIKSLVIWVMAVSMCSSIPWAIARNWVSPPIIACIMSCLPYRVILDLFHGSILFQILSRVSSQGVRLVVWFHIHAPRDLTASLSFIMWMWLPRVVWSCELIFHMVMTLFLWVSVPRGMISTFLMLNLAPDALHNVLSFGSMMLKPSHSIRYRVVSLANRLITCLSVRPRIIRPWISGSFLILHARGSIVRSKSEQERGSPYLTPCVSLKGRLRTLFIVTWV